MQKFVIEGGYKLEGRIRAESAKNAVLPIIAGALLTEQKTLIKNCPKISDVFNMLKILSCIGASYDFIGDDLLINPVGKHKNVIPKNLCEKLRTSVYFLGVLFATDGKACLSMPGGCKIGERPIDIHINALKSLGARFAIHNDVIYCEKIKKVKDAKVVLRFPSVGATVNVLLASVLGNGFVEIVNCAKEPEIVDLCYFLIKMGADIKGVGSSVLCVKGVKKLSGVEYRPMSDRIEIGTFALACAITGGNLEIITKEIKNKSYYMDKILNNTCSLTDNNGIITIKADNNKKCFDFKTQPFPGCSTDLQAQAMAYLCTAKGESVVIESMFDSRFAHVSELVKMGAKIKVFENVAVISGVKRLKGCKVIANDLRGGAAMVLAGLGANGLTEVCGVEHIERGYYNLVEKLSSVGAKVTKKT